jgi:glycosyltransferase involved in cell wall biosynthesis
MFSIASAIVAVSRAMQRKLIELGAPPHKVHYNPYGVDCSRFGGAKPGNAPPLFLAVGRFTEKKSPQTTIAAFARVLKVNPDARLRLVGDGPLLGQCKQMAAALGLNNAITFLGGQNHEVVEQEMKAARCFVQHSVIAPSGDCEGTPVSIIEAGATGLPVIATRHAGIPDVVVEAKTGFLVDEHDEAQMAVEMTRIAGDAALAGELGEAARTHIARNFSKEKSLAKLWALIEMCIANKNGTDGH